MHCRSSSGLPAAHDPPRSRPGPPPRATTSTRATLIDDLSAVPELAALAADRDAPLRSLCAAPLVSRGERVGVLVALANGVDGFLPNDVALLESYAMQAAIALTNAQMFETQQALASRDPLTELFNHREFHEAVARELERCRRHGGGAGRRRCSTSTASSWSTTRRGHAAGDRVLRGVARRARRERRARSDLAFRIGGDEFALLLPDTSGARGDRRRRARRRGDGAVDDRVGVSYGIAEWPYAGPSKDTLLAAPT